MKTNVALVRYVQKAYAEGWKYWYGTTGLLCTDDLLKRKAAQYPTHYTDNRMPTYKQHIKEGRKCADCINLVKGFMWLDEATGKQVYASNQCPDTNANGMYSRAVEKGVIGTLPEIPGLILRFDGHAGVYIGGGWAIEARGFKYGVVKTKVKDRPWTHWYKMPGMAYINEAEELEEPTSEQNPYSEPVKILKKGATGQGVMWIQWHLWRLGYDLGDCGIDGDWGKHTQEAVLAFQEAAGLEVDGEVGKLTRAALKAL